MLAPHEIFARMPAETAAGLFNFLRDRERKLYTAAIESLAQQRKLRPVFVTQKPLPERHAWMREALGRRANDGVAAHLLQIWLVGAHKGVLCDFLDALGIAHDANGTIETLPPAPAKADLARAVESLRAKHDPGVIAVYLHTFQALDDSGGWPTLGELLAEDEGLKLSA